jgi:flagellar motor component MotA
MERKEMITILNGMCERSLIKGIITTLDDAKKICDVFDRFCKSNYKNDDEYSEDILYLYNLAIRLHNSGYTSLEESYSIYNAILAADSIDFIEIDNIDNSNKESIKNKNKKK